MAAIADVRDGTHASPKYHKNGVPLVTSKNIVDGRVDFHEITLISEEDAHEVNRRSRVDRDDILVSMIGTVGNAALVDFDPHFCIKNVALIKSDKSKVEPRFLAQLLRSSCYGRYIDSKLDGGIQKFISLGMLRNLDVPLGPTLAEQEAIADALSDADTLIESLEQLLAKKRNLKQGAMQELLTGKKRLAVSASSRQKQTEIGYLPIDWDVRKIGEISTVKTGPFGSSLHERDYVDDGTPIITVEHLGERGVQHNNLPMVSDFDRKRLKAYAIEEGDIVFSRVGSVDRNAFVSEAEHGWLFSGRLLRLRASSGDIDTRFLSYQFHSEPFKQRVITVAVGQTMASLNTQILNNVLIAVPPRPEQTAIAVVLSNMDAELAKLETKLTKARQLKTGMMQELLTGRIRLV
jgi:type I restriction enzyme S subunit